MRALSALGIIIAACVLTGCAASSPEPTAEEVRTRYIELALECEFGPCPKGAVLPAGAVAVTISGEPRADQVDAVSDAVDQWNGACSRFPLTVNGQGPVAMDVIFSPEDNLGSVLEVYVEGNSGMFNYDWDESGEITAITVGIASELDGRQLRHFVLEEITQSLGLKNDVPDSNSIFDGGTSARTTYSALDRQIISFHCSSAVNPGITVDEVPLPERR
jgi:hypothetical protein